MCTNSENQIKITLGKRIYEVLKNEYLQCLRTYLRANKRVDLSEINPMVSIPTDFRIGNVVMDGQVLAVTKKYMNINGLDFEYIYGDDGYVYFNISSLIEEKSKSKKA